MFAAAHMVVPQEDIEKYNRRYTPSPSPPPANASVPRPPPPPANCPLPPPPPPINHTGNDGMRLVPNLGAALHEAKKRISGEEETPACAEGISTGDQSHYTPSQISNIDRPRSWHGGPQVPGKPSRNPAIINEMQAKLKARKAKLDSESTEAESSPTISQLLPHSPTPSKNSMIPESCTSIQSSAIPNRYNCTPPLLSSTTKRMSWTPPTDWGPNKSVTVDQDRKTELTLAKQVRQGSVKFLQRNSTSSFSQFEQNLTTLETQGPAFEQKITPVTLVTPVVPPSPIVQRYWNQCQGNEGSNVDQIQNSPTSFFDDDLNTGQLDEMVAPWKLDEFPDIKSKIKNLEEEMKPKIITKVPDIRTDLLTTNAKAKGWIETKKKLQSQLDVLLTRTTQKMSIFGGIPDTVNKNTDQSEDRYQKDGDNGDLGTPSRSSPSIKMISMNGQFKSIIQSVANEIQKSFSQHDLHKTCSHHSNEEINHEDKMEQQYYPNDKVYCNHPVPSMEAPVDFDSEIKLLDISIAREKGKIVRKCSLGERRLPASILAKRKAAEKLKEVLNMKEELAEIISENNQVNQDELDTSNKCISIRDKTPIMNESQISSLERVDIPIMEVINTPALERVSTPVIIGTPNRVNTPDITLIEKHPVNVLNVEGMSDEKLANTLAKQISKMQSDYVVKLLKSIERGVLECSIPLLLPFLSLQVRMSMGKHIFKGLDEENKRELIRDGFVNNLIDDISDIAVLQEVIEKSQDKVDYLEFVENAYSGGKNKTKKKDCGVQTDIKVKEMDEKEKIISANNQDTTKCTISSKDALQSKLNSSKFTETSENQQTVTDKKNTDTCLKEESYEANSINLIDLSKLDKVNNPFIPGNNTNNIKYKSIFDDGSDDESEQIVIKQKKTSMEQGAIKDKDTKIKTEQVDKISEDDAHSINSRLSVDEGFEHSEEDLTNSDDDDHEKNKERSDEIDTNIIISSSVNNENKNIEDSEKCDEDEGIGGESKLKTKEIKNLKMDGKSELKETLMNILNNAKSSQPRPQRNFGRNFEVPTKMPVLKPVIPNDRRPAKAKKMDSLWSQITGTQEQMNYQAIHNAATKPISRVPWTKKKNGPLPTETEKLKNDKDIEEYKKCKDKLKNVTIPKAKSCDFKTIEKCVALSDDPNASEGNKNEQQAQKIKFKESEENKKYDKITLVTKKDLALKEECITTSIEKNYEKSVVLEIVDIKKVPVEEVKSPRDETKLKPNENQINSKTIYNENGVNEDICTEKADDEGQKLTPPNKLSFNSNIANVEIRKNVGIISNMEKATSLVMKYESETEEKQEASSDSSYNVVESDVTDDEKEEVMLIEDNPSRNSNKEVIMITPIITRSRIISSTPIITHSIPPPPKGKPPPPPSMAPPPLPISPPPIRIYVNASKTSVVVDITNNAPDEKNDHESDRECDENDESEYSIEYEEVSEWETDSEDELEEECKIEKESWNNILSTSLGPCTYTGSFSVTK